MCKVGRDSIQTICHVQVEGSVRCACVCGGVVCVRDKRRRCQIWDWINSLGKARARAAAAVRMVPSPSFTVLQGEKELFKSMPLCSIICHSSLSDYMHAAMPFKPCLGSTGSRPVSLPPAWLTRLLQAQPCQPRHAMPCHASMPCRFQPFSSSPS